MGGPLFTPEELEELRRIDAEIEENFVMTLEEFHASTQLDREARNSPEYHRFEAPDIDRRESNAEYSRWYNRTHREERAEYARAYYHANREKILARNAAHKEERAEYMRAYRAAKREQILARQKAYYQAHREEILAKARERNARKRKSGGYTA